MVRVTVARPYAPPYISIASGPSRVSYIENHSQLVHCLEQIFASCGWNPYHDQVRSDPYHSVRDRRLLSRIHRHNVNHLAYGVVSPFEAQDVADWRVFRCLFPYEFESELVPKWSIEQAPNCSICRYHPSCLCVACQACSGVSCEPLVRQFHTASKLCCYA